MSSNTNIIILFLLLFQISFAQEKEESKKKRQKFGTTFEINYFQPIFYGDNFISEAYDVSGGVNLGITTSFSTNLAFHFNFSFNNGDVNAPELVGNIRSSRFSRVSLGVGYLIYIRDNFYFVPSFLFGTVGLRNRFNFTDTRSSDNGVFIGINASINYKIIEAIHVNLRVINHFDFFAIDTAPQDQSFFDSAQSIYPSLGLRFKF